MKSVSPFSAVRCSNMLFPNNFEEDLFYVFLYRHSSDLSRHPQRSPASHAYLPLQQTDNTYLHLMTPH